MTRIAALLTRVALAAAMTIAAHGVSHAQSALAPSPRMLVEVADISGLALSPDGAVAAFREERASIERNTYESTWYVIDPANVGPPLRIADGGLPFRLGGMPMSEAPRWSPDSRWLYYRALVDGEVGVWRASRFGDRTEPVTRDAANVETFWIDGVGRRLVYRVGPDRERIRRAEEEELDRGVLIDGSVMNLQGLFRGALINGRPTSWRTGPGWTQGPLSAREAPVYRTVDLITLARRPATPAEIAALTQANDIPPDAARPIIQQRSSPSGARQAFLLGDRQTRQIEVRRGGRTSGTLTCSPCRDMLTESLAWRHDDELILTVRDVARGYAHSLYAWRLSDDSLRLITSSDGLLTGDRFGSPAATCAVNETFALCVAASANAPPRLERVDLSSGERTILFDPNAALARASSGVVSELLTWTDPSGRQFTGHLFTPTWRQPEQRLPLFITYYVCPGFLRGGYGDEWPLLSLANAGIAALCVNGHLPQRQNRDAAVDYEIGRISIETIVDILNQRGLIDRAAIGMGGLSYGSEITLWTAAHSDLLTAASTTSPAVTPSWYWANALREGWTQNAAENWRLGAPHETPERWRQLSPAYYPERIRAPLLLQMAEEEYRAALDYYVPLALSGAAVELHAFPYAGHWKFLPRQKLAAYERDLDWFRFWLQGYVDPDPSKAEQYRRWTALRLSASR
jgi:dipeptidyl aminopeptidase/acylaminoacyl peptidase